MTGRSFDPHTSHDYLAIKYSADGAQQWVARYNGPADSTDEAFALAVDSLGNVYVTGSSDDPRSGYDYATVKYNADGIQQWVTRHNGLGNSWDAAHDLAVDASGNVYVTGNGVGSNTGYSDYATIKYSPDGVQQWVASYNGPGNGLDHAFFIALDSAANIYVCGGSDGSGTERDYATIKYNPDGVQQWVARYDGPANLRDEVAGLAIDAQGNVYVTGTSTDSHKKKNYTTIKYVQP